MSFQFDLNEIEIAGALFLEEVRGKLVSAFTSRRRSNGLRQSHIAQKLGVHRSVVNRELTGDKNMTIMRAGELAETMGYFINVTLTPKENVASHNDPFFAASLILLPAPQTTSPANANRILAHPVANTFTTVGPVSATPGIKVLVEVQ